MIMGIGTDIINISRIRNSYNDSGDPFFQKIYTHKELEEASRHDDPVLYFSGRFAGKEAVFKCLGIDGSDIKLNEIEILGSQTGCPNVELSGTLKKTAIEKGIKNILISLSYEEEYAVAFAIAQD